MHHRFQSPPHHPPILGGVRAGELEQGCDFAPGVSQPCGAHLFQSRTALGRRMLVRKDGHLLDTQGFDRRLVVGILYSQA